MKRTFVVQVGEKKFKHKSSAASNAALISELSSKYALKSPTIALALWHDESSRFRCPMPELTELDADSLIKVKIVDSAAAPESDVVLLSSVGDSAAAPIDASVDRHRRRRSDVDDHDDSDSRSTFESSFISRRQIAQEHSRQLFVLRTHYEYAFNDDADDSNTSDAATASTSRGVVVAEDLYGLCKLQLHPRNFKALRADASTELCAPVVALLGPTAGGKTALVREFGPDVAPVLGFSGQPLPTTSNVNYLRANSLRFLDMEGEDGGLPLTQVYTGAHDVSAGSGERDNRVEVDDALRVTRQVMSTCDQKQLERYMEARRNATRDALPRLAYTLGNVVVYVEAADSFEAAVDVAKLFARVSLFASSCSDAVVSAFPPALVVVQTQCVVRSGSVVPGAVASAAAAAAAAALGTVDFDIESASAALRALDKQRQLADVFASVHVVRIPDWARVELYKAQVDSFKELVSSLAEQSVVLRAERGLRLTERGWFDVAADVVRSWNTPSLAVGQFLQRHNHVTNEVDARIAARAYEFFHRIYHTPELSWYVQCRTAAVRLCAVECVAAVAEDECSALDASLFNRAFELLAARIDARAPCQFTLDAVHCRDERMTHGGVHRLEQNESRIEDAFRFVDAETPDDRRRVFTDTLRATSKAARRSSAIAPPRNSQPDRSAALLAQRLSIYRDVVTGEAASPLDDATCWLCFRRRPSVLLACTHSVCKHCYSEMRQRGMSGVDTIDCPVCGVAAAALAAQPNWRGRSGVRVLSLDGATLKGALGSVGLLRQLEQLTGLRVADMFDLIGGSSLGGVLAIVLGVCGASAAATGSLVEQLLSAGAVRPAALLLEFPLEQPFGADGDVWLPASKFDQLLRAATNDDAIGWSELHDSAVKNSSPKVFAATTESGVDGIYLYANYAQGERTSPTVDCLSLTAWEAARACSAVVDAYENNARVFVDAALGGTPSAEALAADEALQLSDHARSIDAFLSIDAHLPADAVAQFRTGASALAAPFGTVDALRATPGVYTVLSSATAASSAAPGGDLPLPVRSKSHAVGADDPAGSSHKSRPTAMRKEKSTPVLVKEKSAGLLPAPRNAAPVPSSEAHGTPRKKRSHKASSASLSSSGAAMRMLAQRLLALTYRAERQGAFEAMCGVRSSFLVRCSVARLRAAKVELCAWLVVAGDETTVESMRVVECAPPTDDAVGTGCADSDALLAPAFEIDYATSVSGLHRVVVKVRLLGGTASSLGGDTAAADALAADGTDGWWNVSGSPFVLSVSESEANSSAQASAALLDLFELALRVDCASNVAVARKLETAPVPSADEMLMLRESARRAAQRLELLKLTAPPTLVSPTPDDWVAWRNDRQSLYRACVMQLGIGCTEASDGDDVLRAIEFVRRRAVAWLALHGDVRCGGVHTLRALVEQRSDSRWAEYVARVASADVRGDLFVLFAIAESFGVPLLVVTGAGVKGESFLLWHEPRAKLSREPIALVHWNDGDFAPLARDDRAALARVADVRGHLLNVAFADEFASEAALRRARQQRRQAALEGAVEAVDKAVEIAAHLRNAALVEVAAEGSPRSRADASPSSLRSQLAKGRTPRDHGDSSDASESVSSSSSKPHRTRRKSNDTGSAAIDVPEPSSPHRPSHRRSRGADEASSPTKRGSLRNEGKRRNSSLRAESARNDADDSAGHSNLSNRSIELSADDSEGSGARPRSASRRSRNGSGSSDRAATLGPDGSLRAHSTSGVATTSTTPPESPAKRRVGREPVDAEAAHGKARVMSALRALPSLTTDVLRSTGGVADVTNQQLVVLPAALTPLAPMIYALDVSHNELVSISGTSIHTTSGSSTGSPRESDDSSAIANLRRSPTRSTSPRLRAAMQCGATLQQFTGLRTLVLAHNRLTSLPGSVFEALQALEVLDLSHNRLTSLPAAIGDLASLRQLCLAHNALDHLAPQIVNLDALRLLDVSFNKLTLVPAFIADLESLQVLRTEGNPFRTAELRSLFACQTDVIVNYLEANKRALRKLHRASSSSKGLALPDRASATSPEAATGTASLGSSSRISGLSTDIADLLRSEASGGTTSGGATSPSSPLSRSAKVSRMSPDDVPAATVLQRSVSSNTTSTDEGMAAQSPLKSASSMSVLSPANKQVTLVRGITGRRNSFSRSMASMLNMLPTDADKDGAAGDKAGAGAVAPASPVALLRAEKSARRMSVDSLKLGIPFDAEEAHAAAAELASTEAVAAAAQLAVINTELLHYNLPRDSSMSQGPATPKGSRVGRRGSRRLSALEMSQALSGGSSSGSSSGGSGVSLSGGGSGGSMLRRKLLDSEHRSATNASLLQALTDDNDGHEENGDEAAVLEEGRLVPLADFDTYFDCEHVSFLGSDAHGRSIVLSAVRERTRNSPTYRALLRTEDGDERLWLPADMIKVDGKNKLARPKDLLAAATKLRPDLLQSAQLKAYKDARVPAELLTFETTLRMKGYKFGVVYAKEGQSSEDDALANPHGSERFDEFLKLLGETIALQGWQNYRAGLDVATGTTGTQSVYTMFQDCEVMFHVATMLPLQPCKPGEQVQQLARKRHIGNDIVVIVFQDGTTPFDVTSVASEFNHVWFVVQPLKMAGKTYYRLAIACKNGVGEFGPPFAQTVFAGDGAFRSFLLAKLINAERAAYQAPGFAKPIRRSRQMLLDALLETVRSISKSTDKPRQAVGFERDD